MKKRLQRLAMVGLLVFGQIAAVFAALPARTFADVPYSVVEYAIPTAGAVPQDLVVGSDGALWFVETLGNKVGRITTNGTITEYPVPTASSQPHTIAAGPDDAIWFTELNARKIGRITTSGAVTEFILPASTSRPVNITTGPDGNLWFVVRATVNGIDGYSMMRMTPSGTFTQFQLSPFNTLTSVTDVKVGIDGAIWFGINMQTSGSCTTKNSWIGRMTTSGGVTYYQQPTRCNAPAAMTQGFDGAWWFAQSTSNTGTENLGRFVAPSTLTDYPVPGNSAVFDVTAGADGAVWFSEQDAHELGRIDHTGAITEYSVGSSLRPAVIVNGPDGNIWFLDQGAGKIAKFILPSETPFSGDLVYTKVRPNGGSVIEMVDLDSSSPPTVLGSKAGTQFYKSLALNPAGTRLYYNVNITAPTAYQLKPGISAEGMAALRCETPSVSPDGTRLACFGLIDGERRIKIISLATYRETIVQVPGVDGSQLAPILQPRIDWLTNSSLLVNLTNTGCGAPYIARINVDGSGFSQLTPNTCSGPGAYLGRVSEDGSMIAYFGNGDGLWVMRADGSNPTMITVSTPTVLLSEPAWSKDGKYLSAIGYNPATPGQNSRLVIINSQTGAIVKTILQQDDYTFGSTDWIDTYAPPDSAAPTVIGTPDRAASGSGWYNADVTITWSATDPAPSSGTPTTPAPTVASQEGTHLYTSGQSCDPAGNCATGSLTLSIDKSAPTVTYSLSQQPNGAGWNNGGVTVTFTCNDAVSGIASCTAPTTVGEGANQTVTGTAVDVAGNTTSVSVTVSVDATKPVIAYTTTPDSANAAGWFNSDVTIAFQCSDGLSGLLSCTLPVTLSNEGAGQTAMGTAVDVAGNDQSVTTAAVNIDKSAPEITHALSAAPNAAGWNNTDVTVTFNCSDATSGVASCPSPTVVGEGADQTVTGTAYDIAGNGSNDSVSLHVDKTAPIIGYSVSQVPNFFGWNNASVMVTFDCSDALSGIASCSDPVTIGQGANQTVTGTATDIAGNTATVSLSLNIDTTKPTISYGLLPALPNAAGWYNSDVTVSFACFDFLSGVTLCSDPVTLTSDGANQSVNGSVTDLAFNTQTVTVSPINIDKTAPSLSGLALAANPLAVNQTTTLSAQVSDATSGISRAEYFVDAADPGFGNGTSMTIASGTASAAVGSYTTAGLHTFSVRTQDVAGNWSPVLTINLDVYNPAAGYVAGHGFITPAGTTSDPGDTLPTVSGNNIKATLDFTVKYATLSATTPTGDSLFTWGSNCNKPSNTCFVAEASSLSWLIIPGNGTAVYQGFASLSLGGQSLGINYPMRVQVSDGGLTGSDHYQIRIYPLGSDPDATTPMYQASGDLTGGDIRLHP